MEKPCKKLYDIWTTRSKHFWVVADDPESAVQQMKKFIKEKELWDQEAKEIKVVAENYDYTKFDILVM